MRVAFTANPQKPKALELVRRALELVGDRVEVVVAEETAKKLGVERPSAPLDSLEANALVAIGGDGTFLSALQRTRIPILPINAGSFGFLAEVDGNQPTAFEGAIDRLLSGSYFIEERMKLATQIDGQNLADATNEVVIHTSQVAKMRLFEIGIDRRTVGRLRADGVILATPTGSTSYALSALGPIVDPGVEGIVVTALAPFQATQRAVVVDPLRTISVRLVQQEKEGVVVVDGQTEVRMRGGQSAVVYRSPRKAAFIRFGSRFFHRLQGKKILPWAEASAEEEDWEDAAFPSPA